MVRHAGQRVYNGRDREVDVENVTEALVERVNGLRADTQGDEQPILSTTGTRAALSSLDARTKTLERQVRELAAIVHDLSETH
jgi:hypothetical protein